MHPGGGKKTQKGWKEGAAKKGAPAPQLKTDRGRPEVRLCNHPGRNLQMEKGVQGGGKKETVGEKGIAKIALRSSLGSLVSE